VIVESIGDIFLEYVPLFEPFIKYGAHQLWGKHEFEKEKLKSDIQKGKELIEKLSDQLGASKNK
jgi:hypothetical protein